MIKDIKVVLETPNQEVLEEYSKISIAFEVDSFFRLEWSNNGLNGVSFVEEAVSPYLKDYDSVDENPRLLANDFDLRNWVVISAFDGTSRVGGAIIAYRTEGVNMLEGKDDLAVVWDIRVSKAYRGMGVGSKIFQRCVDWAKENNCTRLKVETQNNNVKACKFYVSQGAKLSNLNRYAYNDYPDEIQLIWSIDLE